jgi:hypothetical protein
MRSQWLKSPIHEPSYSISESIFEDNTASALREVENLPSWSSPIHIFSGIISVAYFGEM